MSVNGWCRPVCLVAQLILEAAELHIVGSLDAEDGPAQDQQLAHNGYGVVGYLAFRLDEEQAHGGDCHARAEAGNGDAALQARESYAGLFGHGAAILRGRP